MTGNPQRRVLVLNHFAVPRGSAGGTRHVELFERLKEWDYAIIAADRNLFDRQRYTADDSIFTVPTIGYRDNGIMRILNWASFAIGAVIRGLATPKPDVVYASSPHLLTGVAGWLLARARGAKFVLEIRDLWPEVLVAMGRIDERSLLFRWLSRLERFLYRSADRIVVLAEGSGEAIVSLGFPREKIRFIPNGAEPSDFVAPASREELRDRFRLSGVVFVYAGAHGPANGLELVLDAAEEIQASVPEAEFLLVGDGPSKPRLIRESGERNLANVEFMDPIPKQEMPALLGAADVGLHVLADVPLFRYGVSPNKLFDYMAAALPVLTNVPGEVAALVEDAGAGVATKPNELAVGIAAMTEASDAQRHDWGRSARRYIAEHRSRTTLALDLEEMLDGVTMCISPE